MNDEEEYTRMKQDKELLERVNPVFNTAKMTVFQFAETGDKDAMSIAERLGLTSEETQNSSSSQISEVQTVVGNIMMEIRFLTTEAMAVEMGCRTVVDLPCGYMPRSIRFARAGRRYVGLDLPATIMEIEPVARSIIDPKQGGYVRYQAVDATNYDSMEKALEDSEGDICITTEGLLMYFGNSEAGELCDNIRQLLVKHGGCWITADPESGLQYMMITKAIYGDQLLKDMMNAKKRVQEKSDVTIAASDLIVKIQDGFEAGLKNAMAFLKNHGLKAERIPVSDYMPELTCLKDKPELQTAIREAMKQCAYWKITPLGEGVEASEKKTGKGFSIKAKRDGEQISMCLSGRVDTLTAPELLSCFEEIEKEGTIAGVSVDCKNLEYISSAGLRVLMIMHKKSINGLSLTGVKESVNEILKTTGFSDIWCVDARSTIL